MTGFQISACVTVFVLLQGACSSQRQYADVGVLAGEVRKDEVAAAAKYRNEVVALRGHVLEKGLKSSKAAETQWVGGYGLARGKTVMVSKNYGYLVLQSETLGTGKAVCLFEEEMLDVLAPVQKGQVVNLRCRFSMVVGKPADRAPVFYGCTVDS